MGSTNEKLAPSCPGAILMKGKMLNGLLSQEELKAWVKVCELDVGIVTNAARSMWIRLQGCKRF